MQKAQWDFPVALFLCFVGLSFPCTNRVPPNDPNDYLCRMAISPLDEKYMARALELAQLGMGQVSPNPMVGCVITYKGRIIGEGWHRKFGGPHAEVEAIRSVKETHLLPQSTVYVTLEPCAHHGKTPPCADLLVENKVKRVVMALQDPNPKVNGGGKARLEAAGITVDVGVMEEEARAQNRRFLTNMVQQRPYVILKWAQTADGFLARANGDSKWISHALSRQQVHRWRTEEDAILVGPNTVRLDNPALTVRDWTGEHPLRVVLDRKASLNPEDFQVFDGTVPTRWYTQADAPAPKGVTQVTITEAGFIAAVLNDLHAQGIGSVFVEGGAAILDAFMTADLWDEARIFGAPVTFGDGFAAPHPVGVTVEELSILDNTLTRIENKHTPWRKS